MAYINIETKQYPISEQEIRAQFPETTFPAVFVPPDAYAWVFPAPAPTFDALTQTVREIAPVVTAKGNYEQRWEIVDLPADQVAANQAAKLDADARIVATKTSRLWEAADAYEKQFISGVAVGLLTMGVMMQKPKALAIAQWSGNHWQEYYTRKAQITADSPINTDFSTSGQMPYSVPELREELGM